MNAICKYFYYLITLIIITGVYSLGVQAEFFCPSGEALNKQIPRVAEGPIRVSVDDIEYEIVNEAHIYPFGDKNVYPNMRLRDLMIEKQASESIYCAYNMKNARGEELFAKAIPKLSEDVLGTTIKAHFKREPWVYQDEDLKIVKNIGETLLDQTHPDDIIVFVGRSLYLAYYYWQMISAERNFDILSYSGHQYQFHRPLKYNPPKDEQLQCYKKYVEQTAFFNFLSKARPNSRLVLIDYAQVGQGIGSYLKLLRILFPELMNREIKVLGFADRGKENPPSVMLTEMIEDQKDLAGHASFDIIPVEPRVTSSFRKWEFSVPGLTHFDQEKWCTVNPQNARTSILVDVIKENALRVWGLSH